MKAGSLYYTAQAGDAKFKYPSCTVTVRPQIKYLVENIGKYVVALETYSPFFMTPDGSIWCNGLDGKEHLSECIALFDNIDMAYSVIHGKKFFSDEDLAGAGIISPKINVYVVAMDKQKNICLEPVGVS